MGWLTDHYNFDDNGNFDSADEARSACENGELVELDNGCYWDKESGDEYWSDGEKK